MKIFIKAKPRARENKVEKIDETHFAVAVKEPSVQGRANTAIIDALAEYFGINRANIRIIAGRTGKNKIVGIIDSPKY